MEDLSYNSKNEVSTGRSVWLMRLGLLAAVLLFFIPSIWLFQKFMQTEFAQSLIGRSGVNFVTSRLSNSSSNQSGSSLPVTSGGSGQAGNLSVGVGGGVGSVGISTIPGGSATTTTKPALFTSLCAQRAGQKIGLTGLQKSPYRNYSVTPNTIINASGAYWDGTTAAGVPIPWTITLQGAGPSCWLGGSFNGPWDDTSPAITWQDPYHHSGAMTIRNPDFLVEGFRVNNQGDGIRMESGGSNFRIRGVYLSNIHDDCVENDFLHAGVLEDSLLDGCYVGFSADNFSGAGSDPNNVWQINDNLVYLKRMNTTYKCQPPASGMLFKGWYQNGRGPALVLKNNIFMADAPAGLSCHSSGATLGIPPGASLRGCENNVFVWLGKGPFPNTLPSCFRVTTDASVWNNAVARWKTAHPNVR